MTEAETVVKREHFQCPGDFWHPCGQIVEGTRHQYNDRVAKLAWHEGCGRRFVFAADCLIDLEMRS